MATLGTIRYLQPEGTDGHQLKELRKNWEIKEIVASPEARCQRGAHKTSKKGKKQQGGEGV